MQSLWSRAGCGCRGCVQVVGGMSRQTTTRVARRKPTFGEVFTAFYTTIMGTAAVVDARQKDIRRDDLNRQIDEVKADLDRLMKEDVTGIYPDTGNDAPAGDIHNRYRSCWEKGVRHGHMADILDALGDVSAWHKTPPRSAELDASWRSASLPRLEESISQGKKTDYDALLRLLEQEESELYLKHRVPRNATQLKHSEGATRGLVAELLRAVGFSPSAGKRSKKRDGPDCTPSKQGSEETKPSAENFWDLYYARAQYPRGQSYPSYGANRAGADDSRGLHDTFRAILEVQGDSAGPLEPDDIKERVLKICHNLLVSPNPPTVHTLCTLLIGFDRLGHSDLANAVAMSLVYSTRLEPTQLTLMCLFNHYKERGDLDRIHRLIGRCTGRDSRGIGIRRKLAEDVHTDHYLRRWAQTDKVVFRDGVYVERAWFSGRLVDTIVHGLLSMDRLQQAVTIFAQSRDIGLRFCSRTLMLLLDQCLYALDKEAATKILRTLRRTGRGLDGQASAEQWNSICQRIQALCDLVVSSWPAHQLPLLSDTGAFEAGSTEERNRQGEMSIMVFKRQVDDAEYYSGKLWTACWGQIGSFKASREQQRVDRRERTGDAEQDEVVQEVPRRKLLEMGSGRAARVPPTLIAHHAGRLGQLSAAYGT